jgi:hypothetical protein
VETVFERARNFRRNECARPASVRSNQKGRRRFRVVRPFALEVRENLALFRILLESRLRRQHRARDLDHRYRPVLRGPLEDAIRFLLG